MHIKMITFNFKTLGQCVKKILEIFKISCSGSHYFDVLKYEQKFCRHSPFPPLLHAWFLHSL